MAPAGQLPAVIRRALLVVSADRRTFYCFFFFSPDLKTSSEVGIWGFNLLCPLLLKCCLTHTCGVKITKRRTGSCRNKKMTVVTVDVHRPLSCSSV